MAVLETLPDELFAQILDDLPQRDLASTSLVCRRLRNISHPLLYREPHLSITDQHHTSFDLFLGTLLTPAGESLGAHVLCLTIDWNKQHIRDIDPGFPIFAAGRSHFLVSNTRSSEINQLISVLPLMPRLQVLHLPRLHRPGESSIWSNPLPLEILPPTLRHFTYEWPAPSNFINLETLLTIVRLPRMQTVSVQGISKRDFTASENPLAAAAGSSSLTHLTIRLNFPEPDALQRILSRPRALTHLVYQPYDITSSFAPFGRALRPLHHSLTSLILDFRVSIPVWPRHDRTTTIGSLRDWEALRTVTCTLRVLIPRTGSHGLQAVLPTGIRELDILDDGDVRVGEAVKEVVTLLGTADVVPALERVRVYAGCRKSKSLRRRLRKACWAQGVAFEDGSEFELPGLVL